jgi:hypothetical protein
MTQIRILLCLCTLFVPIASAQHSLDQKAEIYIPAGMPIQIEVKRDESEKTAHKYLVHRTTGPNVHKVKMFVLTSLPDERNSQAQQGWTSNDEEAPAIVWGLDKRVDRLIVVIQRVETDDGVWVIDADDQQEAVGEAIKLHDRTLLRGKFIDKR